MKTVLFLIISILLLTLGCESTIEEKDLKTTNGTDIDPRYYKGISIWGKLSVPNMKIPYSDQIGLFHDEGELDIDELEAVIASFCINEIRSQQNGIVGNVVCFRDGENENINDETCNANICKQSLNICIAHKNLMLAEAVAPIKIEARLPDFTTLMNPNEDGTIDLAFYPVFSDATGNYVYRSKFHTLVPQTDDGTFAFYCGNDGNDEDPSCLMQYTIPPQKPENVTLLYIAAKEAFANAGMAGMKALDNDRCAAIVTTPSTKKKSYEQLGPSADLSQVFVRDFGEVQQGYYEVMQKLVEHENSVGQIKSSQNSGVKNYWEDPSNSRSAALQAIVGNGAFVTACVTPLSNDAIKKGVDFLRSSRHPSVVDDSITDIEEIGRNALDNLNEGMIYEDLSGCLGVDCIELADYMDKMGMTLDTLKESRAYILEEMAVNDRRFVSAPIMKAGENPRLYNLSEKSLVHPPAYWESKSFGKDIPSATDPDISINSTFPKRSSLEFLNAMRNASLKAIKTDSLVANMSPEVLKRYRALNYIADKNMGDRKVVVSKEFSIQGNDEIKLSLLGDFNAETQSETLYLIADTRAGFTTKNDSGYRCALEGNIDGAPCTLSDYILDSSDQVVSSGEISPFDTAISVILPKILKTEKVWLFRRQYNKSMELLMGFDVVSLRKLQRNGHELGFKKTDLGMKFMELPVRTPVSFEMVPYVANKAVSNCSKPVNHCTGYSTEYTPPLENELFDDSDPYENSWKHYLNEARESAAKADRLGDELIEKGLDIDDRTAISANECEAACGGVVNPDAFGDSTDTGIGSECWNYESVPEVSLGSVPICRYKLKPSGSNEEYLNWCTCPVGEECPPCPIATKEDMGCEKLYEKEVFPAGYNVEYDLVNEALGLFDDESSGYSDCTAVREYRYLYENNPRVSGEVFDNMIGNQTWFHQSYFKYLQGMYSIDPDPFFHYNVRGNNVILWSTSKVNNIEFKDGSYKFGCPLRYPYREQGPENNEINCESNEVSDYPFRTFYGDGNPSEWFQNEWFGKANDDAPPVRERLEWGVRMGNIFKMMAILSGKSNGIFVPAINFMDFMDWNLQAEIKCYTTDFNFSFKNSAVLGIPMLIRSENGDDGDYRGCLNTDNIFIPDDQSLSNNGYNYNIRHELERLRQGKYGVGLGDYYKEVLKGWEETVKARWNLLGSLNACSIRKVNGNKYLYFDDYHKPISSDEENAETKIFWKYKKGNLENGDYGSNGVISIKDILTNRVKYGYTKDSAADHLFDENHQMGSYKSYENNFRVQWEVKHESPPPSLFYDGNKMLDALEFACYLKHKESMDCLDTDNIPEIKTGDDILKIESFLYCAAMNVKKRAGKIVLSNVPKTLIDGILRGNLQGLYPDLKGEKLQIYLNIESNLRDFSRSVDNIKSILFESSAMLNSAYYNVKSIGLQKDIAALNSLKTMISTAINATSTVLSPQSSFQKVSTVIGSAALVTLENEIANTTEHAYDAQIQSAIQTVIGDVSKKMTELRLVLQGVEDTYTKIQSSLGSLDAFNNRTSKSCANATLEDESDVGHILYPNTVRRRRYATAKVRYQKALERARQSAFIARRAIEFRLGVDMHDMKDEMTRVEAPNTWVDDICQVTGIDYEQIRSKDASLLENWDPKEWYGEEDHYAPQYVGDYVEKLSDFVESYSFDYPFHDGVDTAVISLKYDIKRTTGICEVESYNQVYFSNDIGSASTTVEDGTTFESVDIGWEPSYEGCSAVLDGNQTVPCIGVENNSQKGIIPDGSEFCYFRENDCNDNSDIHSDAELIYDATVILLDKACLEYTHDATSDTYSCGTYSRCTGDSTDFSETQCLLNYSGPKVGYYKQRTDILPIGDYNFSLWHKAGSVNNVPFKVELVDTAGNVTTYTETPSSSWLQLHHVFRVEVEGSVEIRLYPSADPQSVFPGSVLIYGVQLEEVDHSIEGCEGTGNDFDYSTCMPSEYEANQSTRMHKKQGCDDEDGTQFRSSFQRRCLCNSTSDQSCDPEQMRTAGLCFYETSFTLSLDEIESGALIPSAAISTGNYNYRHSSIALNLVGTNVKKCDENSDSTCYSNAYVPYSMYHDGKVSVRNHERQMLDFQMPNAKVEHGKALTAEVVLTNPLSSNHQNLISGYMKNEFRGRPINGRYVIRIWDEPGLDFNNLEDIQLVWKYRYWTQFGQNF